VGILLEKRLETPAEFIPSDRNLFEKERRKSMFFRKPLGIALFCLAILLAFPLAAMAATTWTVENGESIQEAIDNAATGDTIQVEPGTYEEFLEVNKGLKIEGTGEGVVILAPRTRKPWSWSLRRM
jgi:hypothetical protein